jgi:hypothetical protein
LRKKKLEIFFVEENRVVALFSSSFKKMRIRQLLDFQLPFGKGELGDRLILFTI